MKKILMLVLLALSLPVMMMAKVNRLLTVDTPYVDTDHTFKLSLLVFRPLDTQLNFSLFHIVDISVDSSVPMWFVYLPNFGAKASIKIPVIPLTVGASLNYIGFTGANWVVNYLTNKYDLPVTINAVSLNFSAMRWDLMAALDLKLVRLYGTLDFQFFGFNDGRPTNPANLTNNASYFHPTVGADIALGKVFAVFAEIGYYIPMNAKNPPLEQMSGLFATRVPSDFTAGLGFELNLGVLNLRGGVQYPGMEVSYDISDPSKVYPLPVIPYVNLALQF